MYSRQLKHNEISCMGEVTKALLELFEWSASEPVEHDPEWTSPCEIMPPDTNGMIYWKPVVMAPQPDFEAIPLHSSIREFYGSLWGGTIEAECCGETVILSLAWNSDDLSRILKVIREQVVNDTPVFVANTNSDFYFGVNNKTGTVWLCEPGYPPIKQVAQSLVQFLAEIE
jgi:SecY interacting protein Syd